jgi:hypothetical protein
MTPKYTEGYSEGFSDGFHDKPVPTREVKHLAYMVGAFTTVMAGVAYPRVTIVVATVAWIAGVGWWFYPLARAKFTKPIEVVKEPAANTPPPVTDQRTEAMNAPLTPKEEQQLFAKPVNPRDDDETRRLKVVMTDPEEESA